jgi:hypothetical protein
MVILCWWCRGAGVRESTGIMSALISALERHARANRNLARRALQKTGHQILFLPSASLGLSSTDYNLPCYSPASMMEASFKETHGVRDSDCERTPSNYVSLRVLESILMYEELTHRLAAQRLDFWCGSYVEGSLTRELRSGMQCRLQCRHPRHASPRLSCQRPARMIQSGVVQNLRIVRSSLTAWTTRSYCCIHIK